MRYIVLNREKVVIQVSNTPTYLEGEFESEYGELGDIMCEDGTFIQYDEPSKLAPIINHIDRLEQENKTLQDAVDQLILDSLSI